MSGTVEPVSGGGLGGRALDRVFALAPAMVALSEMGLKEYGLSYARERVVSTLADPGAMVMRPSARPLASRHER